ncbi:hypothetical protein Hanom_Chr07g00611141 [Helianthus anomalus]
MLEELGLDDGKFKFDIEDEIPSSPDKEYEFKYTQEADKYNDVFVEEASDSSDGETVMPKEREFISPLQYFTHDADLSRGDILSWGYLEDLQVYAIRREQGDQHLWDYIKHQAKERYPDWKPQFPKKIVTVLESGEKNITLDIKPPRCLKNTPLCAMEQDFHEDFQGWLYNETRTEVVISLYDKSTGASRRISILDPIWLVNCSKKDIECLFYNKIVYEKRDKVQTMHYQKIGDVCFAKDINSGRYWKTKWRDLEIDEFLKRYNRSQRFKEIAEKAARLGRNKLIRPPPTDQTTIEKEENKILCWDRKRDGDPEYSKYWNEVGRPLRRKMLEEKAEKRRHRAKE